MIVYPAYATVLNAANPSNRWINNGTVQIRELLEVEIQRNTMKKAMFICMNPSKANNQESDKTINMLLDFVLSETTKINSLIPSVRTTIITNLFPYYNTSANNLYTVLENFLANNKQSFNNWQEHNLGIIQKAIDEVDYVIFAWGDPPSAPIHNQKSSDLALYHRRYISKILDYVSSSKDKGFFVLETNSSSTLTKALNPRHPTKRQQMILGIKPCQVKKNYVIETN